MTGDRDQPVMPTAAVDAALYSARARITYDNLKSPSDPNGPSSNWPFPDDGSRAYWRDLMSSLESRWEQIRERQESGDSTREQQKLVTDGGIEASDSERSRPFVIDGYSGPGGVGLALDELPVRHLGIDIEDYSDTYPGEFVQGDASDVVFMASFETPDLLWLSPRCQAYSTLSWANMGRYDWDETPKERYPTFENLNVREVIAAVNPDHYIIENVATCDDLRDPCRLNGLAFGLPIENCRHFETSFPVPDAYERGTPEISLGHSYVRNELAEAKRVPVEWSESEIRSAIPREFVQYLLHYCPNIPGIPLPEGLQQRPLGEFLARADGGELRSVDTGGGQEGSQ